jgi:hypothetical protein
MKVQEFAEAYRTDLDAVRAAVQEVRGLSRLANATADLTPEEEQQLKEKFQAVEPPPTETPPANEPPPVHPPSADLSRPAAEGGGRTGAGDNPFYRDEEAWKARMEELAEMERRIDDKLRRAGADNGGGQATRGDIAEFVNQLKAALSTPTAVTPRRGSGKFIRVEAGALIAYRTIVNPSDKILGGWFKCQEDQSVSESVSVVAVAQEPFSYDEALGAPYHSIKFIVHKRYFVDGRFPVVADLASIRLALASRRANGSQAQPVF